MKTTFLLAAALSLGLAGAAAAQTAPAGGPTAKGNAPVKPVHTVNDGAAKAGHNSFTEGQARQHILNSGYGAVTGLSKGSDGVWRGRASKGGANVDVAMDFKGNVTQGGGAGPGAHHGSAATHRTPMHATANSGSAAANGGGAMHASSATAVVHHGTGDHHAMGAQHHRGHWRHRHHRHHMTHRHSVGMSGVDRNDNGISDKEDRRHNH